MPEYGVHFARGFSPNQAVAMLEDDAETVDEIIIFPPENTTAEVPDEDSGADDIFTIDNLPASPLQAPAEIRFQNNYDSIDYSSDDDCPLVRITEKIALIG
ncbi:hypothetical protein JTB14_010784 [Gonioctena quinquepunctata]|nr:hypothetical protein JTB14_010784 [Gonioctena quinquepunctata]